MMSTSDYIQLAVGFLALTTLIILVWQTQIQNRLLMAQILKDRFDMYKEAKSPISTEFLEMVAAYPENWMPRDLYEGRYKEDPSALRRYLYVAQIYEYFAFRDVSRGLRFPDPVGTNPQEWLNDLISEKEFLEVHNHFRTYYPKFASHIDALLTNNILKESEK